MIFSFLCIYFIIKVRVEGVMVHLSAVLRKTVVHVIHCKSWINHFPYEGCIFFYWIYHQHVYSRRVRGWATFFSCSRRGYSSSEHGMSLLNIQTWDCSLLKKFLQKCCFCVLLFHVPLACCAYESYRSPYCPYVFFFFLARVILVFLWISTALYSGPQVNERYIVIWCRKPHWLVLACRDVWWAE